MSQKEIVVEIRVVVELDDEAFTDEFMAEFRDYMYPFDTIEEHRSHFAQLYARGIVNEYTDFIEGYGPPQDFGIKFRLLEVEP